MRVKEKLNELRESDVYSLLLFALYKMQEQNIPEYSTLSELIYLVDKNSFWNLLEYYGGMTIKIPTVYEFKLLTEALLLYQYVQLDGVDINKALKEVNQDNHYKPKDIKDVYYKLCSILDKYDFCRS